jgi:hypothetical protein
MLLIVTAFLLECKRAGKGEIVVKGQVVDAVTGEGIADAVVILSRRQVGGFDIPPLAMEFEVDDDGDFCFEADHLTLDPHGDYEFVVGAQCSGYKFVPWDRYVTVLKGRVNKIEIELNPKNCDPKYYDSSLALVSFDMGSFTIDLPAESSVWQGWSGPGHYGGWFTYGCDTVRWEHSPPFTPTPNEITEPQIGDIISDEWFWIDSFPIRILRIDYSSVYADTVYLLSAQKGVDTGWAIGLEPVESYHTLKYKILRSFSFN